MTKYKVLWFDDEWEELENVSDPARVYDIELIGVSNVKKGLLMLKNHVDFDAILLDGMFFKDENGIAGDQTGNAFGIVAKELEKTVGKENFIPWFILSGQTSFVKEKNSLVDLFSYKAEAWGGDVVHNKNDDDNHLLWESMVKAIKSTKSFQIRQKYADVFTIISQGVIAQEHEERLITAIQNMENGLSIQNSVDLFNPLRKIIEGVADKLVELKAIPYNLPFNSLKHFIKGDHRDYTISEKIASPVITHIFDSIVPILQEASHGKKEMTLGLEEFHKQTKRSYLYIATTYQVFEILIWLKDFAETNSDIEKNDSNWEPIDLGEDATGTIAQDSQGNYYCNQYILYYKSTHANYKIGDNIKITEIIDNTDLRTKTMFPKRGNKYEKA